MPYSKTVWENNALPAINATSLNNIENGIKGNEAKIDSLVLGENLKGEFTPSIAQEYPLSPAINDSWYIDGLTGTGYTFTTGVLTGQTADNFDKLVYISTGWFLVEDTQNYVHNTGDETIAGVKNFTGGINAPQLVGFKNYIINGGFAIWQRGVSSFNISTTSTYTADRWAFNASVGGSITITPLRDSANLPYNGLLITQSGTPTGIYNLAQQRVENPYILSGKTMTYSIKLRVLSGTKTIRFTVIDSFSGGTSYIAPIVVTSTLTKFSFTFTLPSYAASTIGASDYLQFYFQDHDDWKPFDLLHYEVQLEEGTVATPFENRPYGLELNLCQRYYYASAVVGNSIPMHAMASSGLARRRFIDFKKEMRTTPTVTVSGSTTTSTIDNISTSGARVSQTATAESAAAYISGYTADAEL